MDLTTNLTWGFGVAVIGCLLLTLISVLPGIGLLATIAMLLPATYACHQLHSLKIDRHA